MTKVINIYGTEARDVVAATLYTELKQRGKSCALFIDYEMGVTLQSRFSKQLEKMVMCNGPVDFIVCSSPLLPFILENKKRDPESHALKEFIRHEYHSMDNFDVFLKPTSPEPEREYEQEQLLSIVTFENPLTELLYDDGYATDYIIELLNEHEVLQ